MKDIVKKRKNKYFILKGDFNYILDPITNRKGVSISNKIQKFLLTSWLSKIGFTKIYKYCNPQGGKFTQKNSKIQKRIDQVWISKDLRLGLQKSDIEEMESVTESDHNLIQVQIKLDLIIRLGIGYTAGHKSIEKKIFLYKDAIKEN